ncbi:uncharacterized protein LOC108105422 [Drosophila eugracilis]|uniref:uncharacterized protein LOC108105422 n=1 Tax=Drosophila eugracilis TaxID=29029 RepID=UPI0007E74380|nr:uncharacterized protein LOC108105422 [Drosophila eugracilis]
MVATLVAVLLPTRVQSGHARVSSPLSKGDSQKLSLILEALNELERQRVLKNVEAPTTSFVMQRPNSKRLRWNRLSRTLPDPQERDSVEARGWPTTTGSVSLPAANPDYLNVDNYPPTPAPWWYN